MNTSTTTAGADALASQYNDMRLDILERAGERATTTGSANAQLLDVDSQITAYVLGQRFIFNAGFSNTGTCTLNVNSIGAKNIKDLKGNNLGSGAITSGSEVEVIYDGTSFIAIAGLSATTINEGVVELATDTEASSGTDEKRFINPKQLATRASFKEKTPITDNTTYTASEDGFVFALNNGSDNGIILSGHEGGGTVQQQIINVNNPGSISFPVKKGNQYKVINSTTAFFTGTN